MGYIFKFNPLTAKLDLVPDIDYSSITPGCVIYTDANGKLVGNETKLYIDNTSGNFGIGTTTPAYPLSIVGSGEGKIYLEQSGGEGAGVVVPAGQYLRLGANDQYKPHVLIARESHPSTPGRLTFRYGSNGIYFDYVTGTASYTRMFINSSGYVGIGTTSPTHTLNVVGTANITGNTLVANNLFVNGSSVGIGTTSPLYKLHINSSSVDHIYLEQTGTGELGAAVIVPDTQYLRFGSPGAYQPHVLVVRENYSVTGIRGRLAFRYGASGMYFDYANGSTLTTHVYISSSGYMGLGTTSPSAKLHVQEGAILFNGTTGSTPVSGAGTRFMWIPGKRAFRAGKVDGSQWDGANIGTDSFAFGTNSVASAIYSIALGPYSTASNDYSIALGPYTNATGYGSIVIGKGNGVGADSLQNNIANSLIVGFGTTPTLFVNGSSVGIGTTNPSSIGKIHISGSAVMENTSEPSTYASGGVIFVSSGALYYKGGSGTLTLLANA